jgi:hypothetical protein
MKATLACFGAFVAVALAAVNALAQYGYPPQPCYSGQPSYPVAPAFCGPYYYCTNAGVCYGPTYNMNPPFPPFNGMVPNPAQCGQQPYHPWARGPRDYFMWTEAQRELITRQARPPFVP